MKFLTLSLAFLFCSTSFALEITSCKNLEAPSYIIKPVKENTKSFYNGKLLVTHISTNGEPACCSAHILVYIKKNKMKEKCFAITNYTENDGHQYGYFNFSFDKLKASYDPNKGLLIEVPYKDYGGENGVAKARVNMAKKTLKLEN